MDAQHSALYYGAGDLLQSLGTICVRAIQVMGVGLLILGDRLVSRRLKNICGNDELSSYVDKEAASDGIIRYYHMRYTISGYLVLWLSTGPGPGAIYGLDAESIMGYLIGYFSTILLCIGALAFANKVSKGAFMRFLFFDYPRLVYLLVCVVPSQIIEKLCVRCEEQEKTGQDNRPQKIVHNKTDIK